MANWQIKEAVNLHLLAVILVPLTNPALPSGLQQEVFMRNFMVDIPKDGTHRPVAMLEMGVWKKHWDQRKARKMLEARNWSH